MNELRHCDDTPVPFEQVNSEQLIRSMYGAMTFPDGQTPSATTTTSVFQGDSYNFEPTVPANNNPPPQFFYTWTIDPNNGLGGTPICGGSQAGPQRCAVSTGNLSVGTHIVQVAIQDASTMLRPVPPTAPNALVQWQLNVTACGTHTVIGSTHQGPPYTSPKTGTLSGKSATIYQNCTDTVQDVTTLDCHNNVLSIQPRDTGALPSCSDCSFVGPTQSRSDDPGYDYYCKNSDGTPGNYVCTTTSDDYIFTCKAGPQPESVETDYNCSCFRY